MRMVQFISAVQNPLSHEREAFIVYELMHALHNWRRQLAFHRAFYDWDQEHGMAPQRARARGSCEGLSDGGDADLSNSDWVQKLILQEERLRDAVSTAKVWEWLKNKLGGRGVTHMATAIVTAVEALCELGIGEVQRGCASCGQNQGQTVVRLLEAPVAHDPGIRTGPRARGPAARQR